ncbi:PaaI family thioesterase [Phytohabitans kaempferiae]|uniref:PaaI family thioesterase n=1 Tax=Phytohabitans kaempferiae TaxID=1620943 RepID=A0ABV6MC07_9ACTN
MAPDPLATSVSFSRTQLSAEDLQRHDDAYGALTEAVRELCDAQLRTRVSLDEAGAVTEEIQALTRRLLADARPGALGMELDHDGGGREHGNAVLGLRNPIAMAVGPHSMFWDGNGASATLALGPVYEGPSGCVHGGVIALVLDQLFAEAAAAAGHPGMTAGLTLTYRRPTPLGTVRVSAWVEKVDGRKRVVKARCEDADGNLTVEGEALLILPRRILEMDAVWPKRPPKAVRDTRPKPASTSDSADLPDRRGEPAR